MRALVIVLFVCTMAAGCEPHDRRPGTWLSGEVVTAPVADWSFSDTYPEVFVETQTWYGIPHSVTTTLVTDAGTLYVPSLYYDGGDFPAERYWNRNIARDPDVRVKIGDKIYPRRAVLVTDPAERASVLAAFAAKYDRWRDMLRDGEPERPHIILLRLDPRAADT
jgi:hypothetical protein